MILLLAIVSWLVAAGILTTIFLVKENEFWNDCSDKDKAEK